VAVNRRQIKSKSSQPAQARGLVRPVLPPDLAAEPTLVEEVYRQILLQIIRGEITGGQELKSTLLAKRLKVSRTPVVQALQRLAADGIVSLELNKRATVRPGAENWLVGVHQLRELLEPTAVGLAAQRISDAEIKRLQSLAAAAANRRSPDWAEAVGRFDFALHLAIADFTDNLPLREMIRKCWSYKRLSYTAVVEPSENLQKAYEQHLSILSAIAARDSATASAAMLFHLRSAAALRPERGIV
jgi:DNA-binding GntR family transcriptional regulator